MSDGLGSFDYIVVGAGSAGCAVAGRLSEDGAARVLLLEAGGANRNLWLHVPLGVGKLLWDGRFVWRFMTEPEPELHGQRVYWPRGKVLGGSSSVNGMVFARGDPKAYDAWAAAGNDGWSHGDLLPCFKRMESYAEGDPALRGRDGPLRLSNRGSWDPDPLSDAFVDACVAAGIPRVEDYNGAGYEGASYLQQTAHRGRRWSAADAYLRPARGRRNLTVLTGAHVLRVLFEEGRAAGVAYRRDGREHTARARREVVLSAGAIQSPQLLELSGVGDGARLKRLGIAVVAHAPEVGEGLHDHLQVRFTYACARPTVNDLMRSRRRKVAEGLKYLLFRRGLLSTTSSTAHALARTRRDLPGPDVKIQIAHISGKDRYARTAELGIDPFPGFSLGVFRLHPASRGSVHVRDADPMSHPEIRANYLTHPEDAGTYLAAFHLMRGIAAQPPLRDFIRAETRPGPDVASDDELLDYARRTGQTSWHPIGTCRMGADTGAPVDPRLRVRGVRGLRVIDASIMPSMASCNTNAPAILIGERGADLLREDARP